MICSWGCTTQEGRRSQRCRVCSEGKWGSTSGCGRLVHRPRLLSVPCSCGTLCPPDTLPPRHCQALRVKIQSWMQNQQQQAVSHEKELQTWGSLQPEGELCCACGAGRLPFSSGTHSILPFLQRLMEGWREAVKGDFSLVNTVHCPAQRVIWQALMLLLLSPNDVSQTVYKGFTVH